MSATPVPVRTAPPAATPAAPTAPAPPAAPTRYSRGCLQWGILISAVSVMAFCCLALLAGLIFVGTRYSGETADGPPQTEEAVDDGSGYRALGTPAPADVSEPVPNDCDILFDGRRAIGIFCVVRIVDEDGMPVEYTVPVYEGGATFVTVGGATLTLDGEGQAPYVLPDSETVGNVVYLFGAPADGGSPHDLNNMTVTLTDYVPGAVGVTALYDVEDYQTGYAMAMEAANAMLGNPPNCGNSGCLTVHFHEFVGGFFSITATISRD